MDGRTDGCADRIQRRIVPVKEHTRTRPAQSEIYKQRCLCVDEAVQLPWQPAETRPFLSTFPMFVPSLSW